MVGLQTATGSYRIAVLIDGDNAQPSLIENVIAEVGKYGQITIRRIYGDWTTPNMGGWKETLHTYAIDPKQQFRYTTGKNATDSAMIIDAMDILYDGVVNGFCLVSSDSDFTRLATRIREKGFFVMGIGRQTTPRAFVNACEVFVYTEILDSKTRTPGPAKPTAKSKTTKPTLPEPVPLLKNALEATAQDDGWASLGSLGNRLRQLDPGFDSRTYGHRQLSLLIRAHPDVFEVKEKKIPGRPSLISVRVKE